MLSELKPFERVLNFDEISELPNEKLIELAQFTWGIAAIALINRAKILLELEKRKIQIEFQDSTLVKILRGIANGSVSAQLVSGYYFQHCAILLRLIKLPITDQMAIASGAKIEVWNNGRVDKLKPEEVPKKMMPFVFRGNKIASIDEQKAFVAIGESVRSKNLPVKPKAESVKENPKAIVLNLKDDFYNILRDLSQKAQMSMSMYAKDLLESQLGEISGRSSMPSINQAQDEDD